MMSYLYENCSTTTCVLLAIALILLAGFIMTRITKKLRLPNVTGYILAGILIGPHVLNMVPQDMVLHMDFMSDVALTCIAFGVGQFFKKEVLKKTSGGVIVVTVLESLMAGVVVTLAMRYLVGQNWNVSLILGAIATATAPASTMTVSYTHLNTLLHECIYQDMLDGTIGADPILSTSETLETTTYYDLEISFQFNRGSNNNRPYSSGYEYFHPTSKSVRTLAFLESLGFDPSNFE